MYTSLEEWLACLRCASSPVSGLIVVWLVDGGGGGVAPQGGGGLLGEVEGGGGSPRGRCACGVVEV